jgi:hypothetical protein
MPRPDLVTPSPAATIAAAVEAALWSAEVLATTWAIAEDFIRTLATRSALRRGRILELEPGGTLFFLHLLSDFKGYV